MATPVHGPRTYVTLKEAWSRFGQGNAKVLSNIYAVVVNSSAPAKSTGSGATCRSCSLHAVCTCAHVLRACMRYIASLHVTMQHAHVCPTQLHSQRTVQMPRPDNSGADHFVRVLVRDESTEEWTDHAMIELMLFSREVWPINCFKAGDIIRMHNVTVRRHGWTLGAWIALDKLHGQAHKGLEIGPGLPAGRAAGDYCLIEMESGHTHPPARQVTYRAAVCSIVGP
eukprot:366441-Chlamydomonas_euryale.AAC.22